MNSEHENEEDLLSKFEGYMKSLFDLINDIYDSDKEFSFKDDSTKKYFDTFRESFASKSLQAHYQVVEETLKNHRDKIFMSQEKHEDDQWIYNGQIMFLYHQKCKIVLFLSLIYKKALKLKVQKQKHINDGYKNLNDDMRSEIEKSCDEINYPKLLLLRLYQIFSCVILKEDYHYKNDQIIINSRINHFITLLDLRPKSKPVNFMESIGKSPLVKELSNNLLSALETGDTDQLVNGMFGTLEKATEDPNISSMIQKSGFGNFLNKKNISALKEMSRDADNPDVDSESKLLNLVQESGVSNFLGEKGLKGLENMFKNTKNENSKNENTKNFNTKNVKNKYE